MKTPAGIAADSFAIIRHELQARSLAFEPPLDAVIERIIHSSADFEFAELTRVSPGAIEAGIAALRAGSSVITDVQMARVGISAPRLSHFGGSAYCFVADEKVRQRAAAEGVTRSALGMRLAAERGLLTEGIVAVGNAPTALNEIIRLIESGKRPALIVGTPVGFVGTVESKLALMEQTVVPWVVTTGYKGGSTIAVAIVNALLRLAMGAPATETD